MNKAQTIKIVTFLANSFPNKTFRDLPGVMDAYHEILKDYKEDEVMEAAIRCVRIMKYFPNVGELVQNIIPAQYDKLGIPEEEPDQEKLNEKIRKAVEARRHDLGRNLSDEEYRDVRDEITKIDEIRRKNTRPFQPPKDVVITDEDIAAQTEYIDLPYMR